MAGRLLGLFAIVGLLVGCGPQPSPSGVVTPSSIASASAGASASASPSANASAAASASTSPGALLVDQADIARHLDALALIASQNGGNRAAGTPGYDASADYVAGQLAALGYSVVRSPLDFTFFDEATPVTLTVGEQSWSGPQWLHAMLYSASGDAQARVQAVGIGQGTTVGGAGCDQGDWSDFARGSIALVMSGPCLRRDQVLLAQQSGAVALIGLYPGWAAGQTKRPTLIDPAGIEIPAIAVGSEPAQALLDAALAGGSARLESNVIATPASSDSVVAELAGASDRVVMAGGHLDSVLDGPGINDNGSGVATLLAIAAALASRGQPSSTVRFAFWAGEEFGELGSTAYVDGLGPGEQTRIDAYLNLDMVGSPNPARFVYDDALAAPGSDDLRQALLDALAGMGQPGLTTDLSGASDHYPFELAGIPTGGVFSGLAPLTAAQARTFGSEALVPADACYHLACDGRDNVNLQSAVTLGQAVAQVMAQETF